MDDDSPPRRRRSSPPPADRAFPLTPILIGVVVLGFVIGAGLSMAGKHGNGQVATVSTPEPEPTETLEPAATASPRPHPSHRIAIARSAAPQASASPATEEPASPQPSATPEASASPATSAVPAPSAIPSHAATAHPTTTPRSPAPIASARIVATATERPQPAPTATHRATAAPTEAPTPLPTVAPTAAPTPLPTDDADSSFGRLSASVVRQYLRALARGDTSSAYGAFGEGPGGAAELTEKAYVDPSLQITSVQARGSGDAQSVNVTFTTSSGSYAGQYSLHRTQTGAAVIVSHTVNKL